MTKLLLVNADGYSYWTKRSYPRSKTGARYEIQELYPSGNWSRSADFGVAHFTPHDAAENIRATAARKSLDAENYRIVRVA